MFRQLISNRKLLIGTGISAVSMYAAYKTWKFENNFAYAEHQTQQKNNDTLNAQSQASAQNKNQTKSHDWWKDPEYAPKTYNGEWDNGWIDSKEYKGTRYIVLVRHGQYENENSENENIKRLTPTGEKQAFYTGEYLSKLIGVLEGGEDEDTYVVPISTPSDIKIMSSDLLRAKQTASIITKAMSHGKFGSLNYELDSDLQEGFPCVPSPQNQRWLKSITEIERVEDPIRLKRAFDKYFTPKKAEGSEVVVLVNHGNVIRYMLCKALQIPEEAWLRFSVANGSVSIISIRPSGYVSVRCIGDFGSIPTAHATFRNIS